MGRPLKVGTEPIRAAVGLEMDGPHLNKITHLTLRLSSPADSGHNPCCDQALGPDREFLPFLLIQADDIATASAPDFLDL